MKHKSPIKRFCTGGELVRKKRAKAVARVEKVQGKKKKKKTPSGGGCFITKGGVN